MSLLLTLSLSLSACSFFGPREEACVPVDEGGECFTPSHDAFVEHALASTRAWPQLNGLAVEASEVMEAFDAAFGQPTWIVPIRVGGEVVAASRFLRFGDGGQVRLGEIALYEPARASFPTPGPGQRLVIFTAACGDPLPESCLFREHGWRFEPAG